MAKLSEVLRERGYAYQHSSATLEEITDGPKRTIYLGIDPSADSLQAGQLLGFLVLRRFLDDGHKVILLIGGGTGMIGDPGGKSAERNLLDAETVARNAEAIAKQAKQLFGGADFTMVNNAEWLGKLHLINFLRDIGKHFSVNAMLQREFVKERVENAEQGISYTEFSYALLQAYDYLHLHRELHCDVQVGGSDQWGNIISGVDFIRRKTGDAVYALTWPLLMNKATGKKFGKSEQGTVWLDTAKTSPYQFYQFWLNSEDDAVEEYLLKMTLLAKDKIEEIMTVQRENPSTRFAQNRLAWEATALVHGTDAANAAETVSGILFGGQDATKIDASVAAMLTQSAPTAVLVPDTSVLDALVATGLASSKTEARRFLTDSAVTLNGKTMGSDEYKIGTVDFMNGVAILKRGKRNVCVLVLQ